MERTAGEVGQLIRRRRERLRLAQHQVPGVSSATVYKIEHGTSESFRSASLAALMAALKWPTDGYDRLRDGADPASLDAPAPAIELSSSNVDLGELAQADPDAYKQVMELARFHLERARQNRGA